MSQAAHMRPPAQEASTAVRVGANLGRLALATWLSVAAMELPYSSLAFLVTPTVFLGLELAMVGLLLLALTLLGQRRGAWAIPVPFLCLAAGLGQHYVMKFKGTAFMPSDLLALRTAAAVAGNYDYTPDLSVLVGVAACVGAVACLAAIRPSTRHEGWAKVASVVLCTLLGAACALGAWRLVREPDYQRDYGVQLDYWAPIENYRTQGFVPTFLAARQDMKIRPPQDYDTQAAQDLQARMARSYDEGPGSSAQRSAAARQFSEQPASIVVVMNETFSDLSAFFRSDAGGLCCGYEGPRFFTSGINELRGTLLDRGALAVSAYGGGTCNTEFEFLTGASLAFIGGGKYPFQMYDLSACENLGRQLGALGYETYAMHPNLAANWNRSDVYRDLGFDAFLSIDDFPGAPTLHSGVTDRATYEKALELLRRDGPQLVMDVTMQNHSGYDQGNIPSSELTRYTLESLAKPGVELPSDDALNEYLACIEASDRDLEWFLRQLLELDERVVVVFFGDHQPEFTWMINDALHPRETEPTHAERAYRTNWLVWANYAVAGAQPVPQDPASDGLGGGTVLSCSQLAARALELAGAPLSDWQKAKLAARPELPAINLMGYLGGDYLWHEQESETDYTALRSELNTLDYLNFGSLQELG